MLNDANDALFSCLVTCPVWTVACSPFPEDIWIIKIPVPPVFCLLLFNYSKKLYLSPLLAYVAYNVDSHQDIILALFIFVFTQRHSTTCLLLSLRASLSVCDTQCTRSFLVRYLSWAIYTLLFQYSGPVICPNKCLLLVLEFQWFAKMFKFSLFFFYTPAFLILRCLSGFPIVLSLVSSMKRLQFLVLLPSTPDSCPLIR